MSALCPHAELAVTRTMMDMLEHADPEIWQAIPTKRAASRTGWR